MLHRYEMLWIVSLYLALDGFNQATTTDLCKIANQLDIARRFIQNEATKAKCSVVLNSIKLLLLWGIFMVCAGIDVAKDKHDCSSMNSEGEVLAADSGTQTKSYGTP